MKRNRGNRKPRPERRGERYAKPNDREDRKEVREGDASNDLSWYSKYPNLLIAGGSFPYPYRPGMSISYGDGWIYKVPGFMTLDWIPSIGVSNTSQDPASIMGKEMYSKVRASFSGSLVADAPDFVMYVLALDSIFALLAGLKRVYRALVAWSPDNYSMPDALCQALGLDATKLTSLRAQRTKLWQVINEGVLQSRKWVAPAVMDYFNRHYWMNDNVYSDAPSINSQMYVFRMPYAYFLTTVTNPQGEQSEGVIPAYFNWFATDVDVWQSDLLSYLEALNSWDASLAISGYLRRAFEGSPLFIVEELAQDEELRPVYNEEVLHQIENSITYGISHGEINALGIQSLCAVSQDPLTNAVISNPAVTVSSDISNSLKAELWKTNPWLTSRMDSPNVADNVIASRLQAIPLNVVQKEAKYTITFDCGSELPLCWTYYSGGNAAGLGFHQYAATGPTMPMEQEDFFLYHGAMAAFDWHPLAMWAYGGTNTYMTFFGDVHNITAISKQDAQNLHRICLYSEFNSFTIT